MKKNKALIFFLVASFFALFSHALFPSLSILAYSPYLAFVFITKPLLKALWHSFFCGLIMDCAQSYLPFGFCSIAYCIITVILYKQKWTIFEDNSFSLSIFAASFSLLFSCMQVSVMYFIKIPLKLSFSYFVKELLLMPFVDAIYAFVCFTSLFLIKTYIEKNRFPFFLLKKLQ
ncbi:hypothetical protein COB11_07640 [Candidatus Aerophobetes bacterium]|uniref:Rod shape-determining protein MreD n=1 Tax=Aerophobetes bacterium TaxID=2030807 RepID=A0A2A4YC87_UNCAE|nr:MAG: hypothetical protein COB11_07640 [Candidatus Aerophobetes bacterium]